MRRITSRMFHHQERRISPIMPGRHSVPTSTVEEESGREQTPLVMPGPPLPDLGLPSFLTEEEIDPTLSSEKQISSMYPKSDAWKMHMNSEQREVDRKDLAILQSKVNFLRNPRHVPPSTTPGGKSLIKASKIKPKEIGIQSKIELPKPKEASTVFIASPPVVKFTEYKIGQVYEITLELKNVSSVLRQCRALPPTTPYFSVGLGLFPGEHGLVAPGMSCHYAIRFIPDSLGEFDDEIRVQTQSSNPIVVQLQGRREPPKLTLPSTINIGYCLVGSMHMSQFIVKNEGGRGRFCFMPRASWPATSFKATVVNGGVPVPPFEVRPTVLDLGKDECGVVEVLFNPPAVKAYSQELTAVCDNCQVRHFTLKGESQAAEVRLVSVEDGLTEAMVGERHDISAKHMVKFDKLNPYTYTDKAMVVENLTNVPLPFQWIIYKPVIGGLSPDVVDVQQDRVSDVDSVFSVHPPSGLLSPAQKMEFKVTFAPPLVDEFHSTLHMLLQQVPPKEVTQSATSMKSVSKQRIKEEGRPHDDDDSVSEIFLPNDVTQSREVTALELEVKGESVPLNVVLHPYAVFVPGQYLVGTTLKNLVTMANHSRSTITFQWQAYSEQHILEVEPPYGELDPGMAMDMELSITGVEPGKLSHTLYCYVMNMTEPLHLHVECDFKGPEVKVEEPDVNFGLIRLGKTVEREITITNLSQVTTTWTIQDSPDFSISDDPMAPCEFTFVPSTGALKPLESRRVLISFKPSEARSVRQVFEVHVENGKECVVSVLAEVQTPTVCLSSCEVSLDEVYLEVPSCYTTTMINQTLLLTEYYWGDVKGEHAKDCTIEIEGRQGVLHSREEKRTNIFVTPHRMGEFSDIRIPCFVVGMDKPVVLGLYYDTKGLTVEFEISPDGKKESKSGDARLDFGNDVALGSNPKLFLHITNKSAIATVFSVSAEHFFSKPPTPPEAKNRPQLISQRRSILSRTPNIADPLSRSPKKAQTELCQALLSQGKGAAFVAQPASGNLMPFAEEVVEIGAYSDMWGQYSDRIVCKIGDEETYFPIRMGVMGCPLQFQMTGGQPNQPIIRLGAHVAGIAPTTRMVKINNSGPYDVRVDWEVFNIDGEDEKVVDFLVSYGRAFPPRDEKGNEIQVVQEGSPVAPQRPPTGYLPNSPDTSPVNSRESTQSPITTKKTEDQNADSSGTTETEEIEEEDKIISVFFRPHDGEKSESPYAVKPKQLLVPARSHASVQVQFTPPPTDTISRDKEYRGYTVGYMSLDKQGCRESVNVTRGEGYEVSSLRLDMTAFVKPALLTVECTEEEGMQYMSAMSDLLEGNSAGRLLPESLKVCSTVLYNNTETPLTFRLLTKLPFTLVDLNPLSNSEGAMRAQETDMNVLKPRHNLLVKVAFQTTSDIVVNPQPGTTEITKTEEEDNVFFEERKLDIKDDLIVEFNNGHIQKVLLHAVVSVPQIELSKESLDFGTCLVGQERELQFLIMNRTASHSHWTVKLESTNETCSAETFQVTPSSGLLEAFITHVSNSKALIKVFFKAKHAESYEAVFVFEGVLGESARRLYVRGQGSYDGNTRQF
ncbi:hypothetical protein ScPMuIL_015573 [Solemya velum]